MDNQSRTSKSIIAAGVLVAGIVVAALVGYLVGHSGGDDGETTVTKAAAVTTPLPGPAARLSPKPPKLTAIGAGLKGPSGVRATIFSRLAPTVEAMTPAPRDGVFAATARESAKPVSSVFFVRQGAPPVEVIKRIPPATGLAWVNNRLYVSTFGSVDVYSGFNGASKFATHTTILKGLPVSRMGFNGSIAGGPDGRMYLAIGSPCDHCVPEDARSASIVSFKPDGSDVRFYATQLRGNAFLAFKPGTSDLFMATNNRDDKPPPAGADEFGLVREGDNWGYPRCYRQGGPACAGVATPLAFMDPHGAQNGLTWVQDWGGLKGASTLSSEFTMGKVIQTSVVKTGNVYKARPQVAFMGFKNPSAVLARGRTALVADFRTGLIYALRSGADATAPAAAPSGSGQTADGGGAPAAGGGGTRASSDSGSGSSDTGAESTDTQASSGSTPKADSTVKIAADPGGKLKFSSDKVKAKAGEVGIDFVNKSSVPHNVFIAKGDRVVAKTKTISGSEDKATVAKLTAGTYTFYCEVSGHEEAGMKGVLTVK